MIIKNPKIYSFITTHFLSILIVVFYITEGYSKYVMLTIGERPDIAKVIKIGVLIFVMADLIKNYKLLIQLFFIVLSFVVGQLFISPNFDNVILGVLLKYMFPILLFAYFNKNKLTSKAIPVFKNVFEGIIILNSILIFLGFIFEIQLFKTYGGRFGYNGLFVSSAAGTYAYLVALFYFLVKNKEVFIYDIKSVILMMSCLLIGTKSIYLSLGLILMLYFFFYTNKKQRIIGVSLMSIILMTSIYYALFIWGIFNNIWVEEGIWTSILSYRDKLFLERTLPFIKSEWTVVNYMFGGVNTITTRSQMGFIDVFYFFGILGGVFYLYSYIKNLISFKLNKESLLFLGLLCIVIFIAGNFFLNASVVIYILAFRESIFMFEDDVKAHKI